MHAKPCGILDVEGYFRPLLAFLDTAVREGFVPATGRARLIEDTEPQRLVSRMLEIR